MTPFELLATVLSLTAIFSWINHRWLRLPPTIGLMALALTGSLLLLASARAGVVDLARLTTLVHAVDFDATLLNGMLGALLFAGSLHVDIVELRAQWMLVGLMSTLGVVLSTLIVGAGSWWLTSLVGISVPFAWCLVFGALISPTDPIAVGAILKSVGVPKRLEVAITGESLFNDGVGVVVFLALLGVASGGAQLDVGHITKLFAIEAVGGCVYGGAIGWLTNRMLSKVDAYPVEILLTLALTTGGYALANRLHVSGPLAMVVAGLIVGSHGRAHSLSTQSRVRLDEFWELVDEFLNAILFVLMGVEVIVIQFSSASLATGVLAIPLVLFARVSASGVPLVMLPEARRSHPGALPILTWAGLRGGISVALALSLPASEYRATLITMTYVVVCFSILVQGLTVGAVVKRVLSRAAASAPSTPAALTP